MHLEGISALLLNLNSLLQAKIIPHHFATAEILTISGACPPILSTQTTGEDDFFFLSNCALQIQLLVFPRKECHEK